MPTLFFSNLAKQASLRRVTFTSTNGKVAATIKPEGQKAWKILSATIDHVNLTASSLKILDASTNVIHTIGAVLATAVTGTYPAPNTVAEVTNPQKIEDAYVSQDMYVLYDGGGSTGINSITVLEWDNTP